MMEGTAEGAKQTNVLNGAGTTIGGIAHKREPPLVRVGGWQEPAMHTDSHGDTRWNQVSPDSSAMAAAGRVTTQVNHVNGDDLHLIHRSKRERDWFIHTVASDDRLWFSGVDGSSTHSHQGMRRRNGYDGLPILTMAGSRIRMATAHQGTEP
jgi:hypothetical protein